MTKQPDAGIRQGALQRRQQQPGSQQDRGSEAEPQRGERKALPAEGGARPPTNRAQRT